MMAARDSQSWRTDELSRLEARIDEAAHALASEVERSAALVDEIDRDATGSTDADVEEFRNAVVNGPNDTAEWRTVAERVARGDYDWRDVVEGNLRSDPDVNAAFASIRGLAVGEDDADADDAEESRGSIGPGRIDGPVSDDDYFDQSIFEQGRGS